MKTDVTEPLKRTAARSITQSIWHVAVQSEDDAEHVHVVRGPSMRVGTHASSDLVLVDRTVSRVHAELTPLPEGVRVRDLGSRNGTSINGVPISDGIARAGMTAEFGHTRMTVRAQAHETTPAPRTSFGALHGNSEAMRTLFLTLEKVAASDATVLVQAESGCGKELLARSIHEAGPRKASPFVVFDCASVAPSLIESALFGHERGAFTGATERHLGLVEEADGGTLFIDEVGELPLSLQPRLLRFLERRTIQRVGGNEPRSVDVRVVAATHRDLLAGINEGTFREDLYYRLAVMRLRIPPLRERLDDLEILALELLTERLGSERLGREVLAATDASAWTSLRAHGWRGNVRELRNVIEHALALSPHGPLSLGAETPPGLAVQQLTGDATVDLKGPYVPQRDRLLEQFDRAYLSGVLAANDGNFSRAAAVAGIDRMYFKRLLKKHGLGE